MNLSHYNIEMLTGTNVKLMYIFRICLGLATLISLYMMMHHIYTKSYRDISCWRFPMLLALFLESFII
jgi:hypothetical protein